MRTVLLSRSADRARRKTGFRCPVGGGREERCGREERSGRKGGSGRKSGGGRKGPGLGLGLLALLVAAGLLLAACETPEERPDPTIPEPDPFEEEFDDDHVEWWNERVFYQIFVRSFYDSSGDGVGDFAGMTEKLDYLEELGIGGIWLLPVNPSPSYHGYDVTDYYGFNPEYGSMEEFQTFLDEAEERDIKVLVDLVVNHSSWEHPWFEASQEPDSEYRDWYIWQDEPGDYLGPWGQPVWHENPHPDRDDHYLGIFWHGMPDLNYENPEVTEEMYDVAEYWLTEIGVDGFRLDAIKHLIKVDEQMENTPETIAWFEDFRDFYKDVDEEAFTVGEVWSSTREVVPYVERGAVDAAFEFDLADLYFGAAERGTNSRLHVSIERIQEAYPAGGYASFVRNHDMNRFISDLDGDLDRSRSAAALLLTGPGFPFVYYGEEIGMEGTKPDPDIRRPMQWDSDEPYAGFTDGEPWRELGPAWEERSVATMEGDPDSLLEHYRSLITLRNERPSLQYGRYDRVHTQDNRVAAFVRYTEEESSLVTINLSGDSISSPHLEMPGGPFDPGDTPELTGLHGTSGPADAGGAPEIPGTPEVDPESGGFAVTDGPDLEPYETAVYDLAGYTVGE